MSSDLVVLVSVNFHWLSGPQFSLDGIVGQPVHVLFPGFEILVDFELRSEIGNLSIIDELA